MSEAELTAALGAAPPKTVAALPAVTRTRLAGQIVAAKSRMDGETEAAVQKAIAGVPFAVRGIVRKALLG